MNLRSNVVLASLVSAGIIAWLTGFTAENLVEPRPLKHDAVKIEVAETAAPAAAAAKAAGPEPILAMIATADAERGKTVAKACAACHSLKNDGKNGVGPNLWGVVGRKKDSVAGFAYSGSLVGKGGDTWTYEQIAQFLWKPKAYAAGTKMTYAGIKKPEDRAAVVAYLRTLADAPLPLPTDAEIVAEKKDLGAE
ncbi:MAG: cytochrome c family protein [Pseudobdellovibrionaceae bacterium]